MTDIQNISTFLGSLYPGIQGVRLYTPGISNFMAVLQYTGGGTGNFIIAAIGCAVSIISGFILTAAVKIRQNRTI